VVLFLLLIVIMPYIKHPLWDHQIGAGMTVNKAIGGGCLLYALVYLSRRRGGVPVFFQTTQSVLMMMFIGLAALSFFTKGQAIGYINPMFMYASTVLLFFLTFIVVDSFKRLYWCLMAAIGGVGFASLYMIREWQKGITQWGGNFRPGWIVGDSNYFTVAALVTLPLSFELMMISEKRWQRVFSLGCLCLTMLAIMLGASRGGFLGIVVGLGYLIFRSERRARNIRIVSIVIIPFLVFAPNSPVRRFIHPVVGDTASVQKHLIGWKAGLNMALHNPLTGVGLGNYKLKVAQYDTTGTVRLEPHIAHNAYLEIAAEMGIPALALYLIFMASAFFSLDRTRKRALRNDAPKLAALAIGMQAALLGVWVAIFFVSAEYTKLFWFLLVLTMVIPPLVPRRPKARPEPPPEQQLPELEPQGFQIGEALVGLR
jgi:O-antigen ligase